MSAIRVLIVDDHPVTREVLHAALALANDVVVVGEADSGEHAVQEAGKLTPDIVFMDVRKHGMSGIDSAKAILEASPTTKVILITMDESRASMDEALRAGVSGYLLNDPSADELVRMARRALEAVSSTRPDPPPLPPAASAALAVPIQQAEDVPAHVGKPLRRKSGSALQVV
jgi:two-component system, NarL family, response regulator LiaR